MQKIWKSSEELLQRRIKERFWKGNSPEADSNSLFKEG